MTLITQMLNLPINAKNPLDLRVYNLVLMAKQLSNKKTYSGWTQQWSHESEVLGKNAEGNPVLMKFTVFLPPTETPVPVVYWLSGLTCTDENFITKAVGQRYAANLGFALVCPDTSPRKLE